MIEYRDEFHSPYLALRFYKPNVEEFSEMQKMDLAQYLLFLEDAINSTGTKCVLERSDDDPPNGNRKILRGGPSPESPGDSPGSLYLPGQV